MRALSIQQPWAWAILYLGKRVENRTWYTGFRGPIYIHAGKKVDRGAFDYIDDLIDEKTAAEIVAELGCSKGKLYCGYLVGTATVTDCVKPESVADEQGAWANGPWCFVLDDVKPLPEPIPHKGALGFFEVTL